VRLKKGRSSQLTWVPIVELWGYISFFIKDYNIVARLWDLTKCEQSIDVLAGTS